MLDASVIATLTDFLVDALKEGDKTRVEVKQLATDAFAKQQKGLTVISASFEGGGNTAVINCHPGEMLAAARMALRLTDPENAAAKLGTRNVYADLSGTRIET